jgi:hypothetical protein
VTAAAAAPAGTQLRNFLVRPVANPNGFLGPPVRVHVHAGVTAMWLTPNPLTVRQGTSTQRLTVLARFDDGVVGDVTNWPDLRWRSSDTAAVQVTAERGRLVPQAAGRNAQISVRRLPNPPAAGDPAATVRSAPRPCYTTIRDSTPPCGRPPAAGRPRPAAPRLLLGRNLGGWRGLVRTAIAGTTVTVGLRLLPLLLLPRWLNSTSWLRTRYLVGRVPACRPAGHPTSGKPHPIG